MEIKTPLERACQEILGEENGEHYRILANLLLLNYQFIEKNDPRLSAKVTAILFDESNIDKVHFICEHIEDAELNIDFTQSDLSYARQLIDIDPELKITLQIVKELKATIKDSKFFDVIREKASDERDKWMAHARMRKVTFPG